MILFAHLSLLCMTISYAFKLGNWYFFGVLAFIYAVLSLKEGK